MKVDRQAHTLVTSRVSVLIADDNEINRRVAVGMLAHLGYDTAVACDGVDAVEKARLGSFDLILMDCQMPVMDGFGATLAIRAEEGTRRTPILALTSSAFEGDEEKCLAAGMDGYISKPVTSAKLLTALEAWTVPPRFGHVGGEAGGGVLDAEIVDEIRQLGDDTDGSETIRLLLDTFLTTIDTRMTELDAALQEGDADHVAGIAHSIRGSSWTFGARRVGEVAAHIERLATEGRLEDAADEYRNMRPEMTAAAEALPSALGLINPPAR